MLRLVIVLAVLAVFAQGGLVTKDFKYQWNGRIVGGQNATIEQHPHQISMLHFGSHRCGGSVISNSIVVTAAHCVRGSIRRFLSVRAGSTFWENGGTLVGVTRALEHDDYNIPVGINNDIGLLFLAQPLVYSDAIRAIALPQPFEDTPTNANATISGWGTLEQGANDIPDNLRSATVPVVSLEQCRQAYGEFISRDDITDVMVCAGFLETGGVDSCQGDSGGPFVVNNQLHGVVSWGFGCAQPGLPGVYARTSHFVHWIDSKRHLAE